MNSLWHLQGWVIAESQLNLADIQIEITKFHNRVLFVYKRHNGKLLQIHSFKNCESFSS